MACGCITKVDAHLAPYNTRLQTGFSIDRKTNRMECLPIIGVEKINKRVRQEVAMVPSFCPFCGERYKGEDQS